LDNRIPNKKVVIMPLSIGFDLEKRVSVRFKKRGLII
jgi:hypothetical protein